MARPLGCGTTGALDASRRLARAVVRRRHDHAVRRRGRGVGLDDAKRVEPRGDRRPAVHRAERLGDAANRLRLPDRCRLDDVSLEEARDEVSLRLDERDHLRPHADGGCGERCLVLDAAIDTEQLRVLAADTKHVGAVVERDLEVAVRDAAPEHVDHRVTAGPDPFDHLLHAHGRAMVDGGCDQPARSGRPLTRLDY